LSILNGLHVLGFGATYVTRFLHFQIFFDNHCLMVFSKTSDSC